MEFFLVVPFPPSRSLSRSLDSWIVLQRKLRASHGACNFIGPKAMAQVPGGAAIWLLDLSESLLSAPTKRLWYYHVNGSLQNATVMAFAKFITRSFISASSRFYHILDFLVDSSRFFGFW